MSFADDETSVEDSQPRDLYEFVLPVVTHRRTSAVRDIVYGGQRYRAGTVQRGDVKPAIADGTPGETEITLISTDVVAQSCLASIPPTVDVNVYRLQLTSGERELAWAGRVAGAQCEGHLTKLLVVSRMGEALTRRIPTITVGRECAHGLYDARCTVNRNLFRVDTTIVLANGRSVTVAGMGGKPDFWAQFGELVHVTSGERTMITSQLGTALEIFLPLSMQAGDAVEVYAGCDHDVATCFDKFANQVNFGGFPQLPKTNPFVANGYGIYESED